MWGWNQASIASLGTLILGVIGAYGQYRQAKLIWQRKSAQSVSNLWTITFFCMFIAYFIQGLSTNKVVMEAQGVIRVFCYIPIIIGIVKFSNFSVIEKRIWFTMGLLLILMISPKLTSNIFVLFGYLGVGAATHQPWTIWKKRDAGAVSIALITIYTISILFWMWYAIVFRDMKLCIVYVITIGLWIAYRPSKIARCKK
jgi:uncharacterized protein with PQ loop repeat